MMPSNFIIYYVYLIDSSLKDKTIIFKGNLGLWLLHHMFREVSIPKIHQITN